MRWKELPIGQYGSDHEFGVPFNSLPYSHLTNRGCILVFFLKPICIEEQNLTFFHSRLKTSCKADVLLRNLFF
jgi:hypothetical protein